MNAAAEKRKVLRDELTKIEEKKQQDRNQLEKEFEDVALADEIVNKRRNKTSRRASSGSTSSDQVDSKPKTTRRQSALAGNNLSSNSTNNSNNNNNSKENNDGTTQNNPILTSPESPREDVSVESQGIHSSIPPQYQKLLQLGLSQEQVIYFHSHFLLIFYNSYFSS